MPEDHLRAVARFQRHLSRVLNRRQPVTDEGVAQRIVLPGERLPALKPKRGKSADRRMKPFIPVAGCDRGPRGECGRL
jgi:hypothetical protein